MISGYALDAGTTDTDTGVAYVELLIDRAVASTPGRHPLQLRPLLHLLRRHGRPDRLLRHPPAGRRADLTRASRTAPTAASASCSTSATWSRADPRLRAAYHQGAHILTIRAGDHASQLAQHRRDPGHLRLRPEPAERGRDRRHRPAAQRPALQRRRSRRPAGRSTGRACSSIQILVDGHPHGIATYGFARPGRLRALLLPGLSERRQLRAGSSPLDTTAAHERRALPRRDRDRHPRRPPPTSASGGSWSTTSAVKPPALLTAGPGRPIAPDGASCFGPVVMLSGPCFLPGAILRGHGGDRPHPLLRHTGIRGPDARRPGRGRAGARARRHPARRARSAAASASRTRRSPAGRASTAWR